MTQASQRTAGWVRVLLFLSLGLNLVVIGVLVGSVLSPDGPRGRGADTVARELGATPFIKAMPPEDRRAFARTFRDASEPLRRNRAEMRDRLESLLEALRADEFDAGRVETLLAEQRLAGSRRQEIGEAALVAYLAGLGPEDRRAYAERLEEVVFRTRPGGRGGDAADR